MKAVVAAGTTIAATSAALTAANRLSVPMLRPRRTTVIEPVVVCVPARDEARRLPGLIADLRAQQGVPRLRVLILDDRSSDGTYAAAVDAIDDDRRFTMLRAESEPAAGWTGKAAACARLAEAAGVTDDSAPGAARALIFLDADLRLAPDAIAAAVTELRRTGAGLVSPWPRQLAGTAAEALVQPLLCWSWAATVLVRGANRGTSPATAVACGQFLVFDTAAYRAAGGHAAVRSAITEDLALARAVRRAGHRTVLVTAGRQARTRMYTGATELDAGYTRWLWSAYGSAAGSAAVAAVAILAYGVPPLAAVLATGRTRRLGLAGYACAVTSRLLARSLESGGPIGATDLGAALAHPLSVGAYLTLSVRSHLKHAAGSLTWKGRNPVVRAEPENRDQKPG